VPDSGQLAALAVVRQGGRKRAGYGSPGAEIGGPERSWEVVSLAGGPGGADWSQ